MAVFFYLFFVQVFLTCYLADGSAERAVTRGMTGGGGSRSGSLAGGVPGLGRWVFLKTKFGIRRNIFFKNRCFRTLAFTCDFLHHECVRLYLQIDRTPPPLVDARRGRCELRTQ